MVLIMVVKKWFNLSLVLSIALLAVAVFTTLKILPARAADNDFSDGITVDSNLDTSDVNIGNGICDDGGGNCTLRAAIEEANSNADVSTIKFNIAGAADFTNGGEDGYRIILGQELPQITAQVHIDGYSQPGAQANTAIAPNPINAVLLVEVDGSGIDDSNNYVPQGIVFYDGSDNSSIRGLVINDFTAGRAIQSFKNSGLQVQGNFIGTSPDGMSAEPNSIGLNGCACDDDNGINVLVGGLDPEDRNIISGNSSGTGPAAGYPAHGWVVQGNYVGVGIDGTTAIPNSKTGGSGAFSIDFADDVLIGGTGSGAINIISGNNSFGLAPHMADGLIVQGNYIGTDYTGMISVPNNGPGIGNSESEDVLIGGPTSGARNVIASNSDYGVSFILSGNFKVQGNLIGVFVDGITAAPNGATGINTQDSSGLIGGTSLGEGNIIANSQGSSGYGVNVSKVAPAQVKVSILRNSIYSNQQVGIALDSNAPLNDPLDPDTGANDHLNSPQYTDVQEVSGDTSVDYRLDVPAGAYRIEFFSNTAADPSGSGEGETYLGFQDVTHSGGGLQQFSATLTGVTGVTNLALTATERNMPTPSTFGATSHFGGVAPQLSDVSIEKTILNPGAVSAGGTIEYQLTVTNNGFDDIDLTQFNNPLGTAIITDFLDPDLTPANLGEPGPFDGTYYLSNVGNPDITCLWGGPGSGALVGLTTYAQYSFVTCTFTGVSDTTLEAGESLSMNLDVSIAEDSDMVFTNYALAAASLLDDPDNAAIASLFGSGGDYLELFIANQTSDNSINNFASAPYPLPVSPGASVTSSPASPLAAAGTNEAVWILMSSGMLTTAAWLAIRLRKNASILH